VTVEKPVAEVKDAKKDKAPAKKK